MSKDLDLLRMNHLEENIQKGLLLLKNLEEELIYETNPLRKAKYNRDREALRNSLITHKQEFEDLRLQIRKYEDVSITVHKKLDNISHKLDFLLIDQQQLLDDLALLREQVLDKLYFQERNLLQPIIEMLEKKDLEKANNVLTDIDHTKIDSTQIRFFLENVKIALKEVSTTQLIKDESQSKRLQVISQAIDDPKLEIKHRLKLSVPIIPFLLSYEGETSLNNSVNLQAAWDWLIQKTGHTKE